MQDRPERVDMCCFRAGCAGDRADLDGSGRTLLAWFRLMVMRNYMPGDPMNLSQPSNLICKAGEDHDQ